MGCNKARSPDQGKEECPCKTSARYDPNGDVWVVFEAEGGHNHSRPTFVDHWIPPKPPTAQNAAINNRLNTPDEKRRKLDSPSPSTNSAAPNQDRLSSVDNFNSRVSSHPSSNTQTHPFQSRIASLPQHLSTSHRPNQLPTPPRQNTSHGSNYQAIGLPTFQKLLHLLEPGLASHALRLHRAGFDNSESLVRFLMLEREEMESVLAHLKGVPSLHRKLLMRGIAQL